MNQINIFKKELSLIIDEVKIFNPISIVLYRDYSRDEGGIIEKNKMILTYS